MYGRSADINLAEICYKMSELFDKQMNAQKETSGVHVSSCKPMKKVCDKNESRSKENKSMFYHLETRHCVTVLDVRYSVAMVNLT